MSEDDIRKALLSATEYLRNRHNMGPRVREKRRIEILQEANEALSAPPTKEGV